MAQLPDGYQEVEYIKYTLSKRYCVGGFSSQEEAEKRISELKGKCPSVFYDIGVRVEHRIIEYIIIIPEDAVAFLSDNEKRAVSPQKQPSLQCEEFTPTVYRFIPEKYVDLFFETGSLKITSFSHCKAHESKTRRDSEEGQGIVIGIEGNLRCEIRSGVGETTLLLCTSLSENNNLPDGTHYSAAIKIDNLNGFIEAVTNALVKRCYGVSVILKGPCIYNNRSIQREIHDQGLSKMIDDMKADDSFDISRIFALQHQISSYDLFFSKPLEKSIENEYRILWLLDCELKEDFICIDVPEARQYCQKIVF